MKIAVYYNLPYGGAKRAVFEQVKGLKKLGHIVDIYTLDTKDDSFNPSHIADTTVMYDFTQKTVNFPIVKRIIKDYQIFYTLANLHQKIAKDIDSKHYDIVLCHTDSLTQAPFLLRFLKTASVYYCLEPLRIGYEYSLRIPKTTKGFNRLYELVTRSIRKGIDRENARTATYSLALSFFCRAYMVQTYDIYAKVVYLGVDKDLFRPLATKKKLQVLFIAGKDQLAGYDLAQNALSLIPEKIRPELKIIFGIKQKERITDADVVKAYNESIATLSLSRLDTFGLVPLESMACATPVIATNIAGYRELVQDNKTGFLVEFDPQEIADKIIFLIQNPKIATSMGMTGRTWVEKDWTWEKQNKHLETLLFEFIDKSQPELN